jgi:agmatinase
LKQWGGLGGAGLEEADVVLAGIPYDGSAVYRKGAAGAPARIRQLSAVMPPVTERGGMLAGLRVHNLGDLAIGPEIERGWKPAAERLAEIRPEALLTVLGGDHCASIPVVAAQKRRHPDLVVAWIDAHPDLCDFSRGGRWTCGCALRRSLELSGLGATDVAVVGGRDFDPEEVHFVEATGMPMWTSAKVAEDVRSTGLAVARWAGRRPLHISFDIDFLDPAYAPGTEIPSAGGFSTRQALDLLRVIGERTRLVGLDIAEVSPAADSGDITSLAALKLIFEFWGLISSPLAGEDLRRRPKRRGLSARPGVPPGPGASSPPRPRS